MSSSQQNFTLPPGESSPRRGEGGFQLFRKSFVEVLCFALIAFIAGCSRTTVPVSDVDAATKLVETSFAAWQSGRTVADLREAQPPVYVAEELWSPTFKLARFSIDGPGTLDGSNVRVPVTIEGADASGKPVRRQMIYIVTTTPAQTIARADR